MNNVNKVLQKCLGKDKSKNKELPILGPSGYKCPECGKYLHNKKLQKIQFRDSTEVMCSYCGKVKR